MGTEFNDNSRIFNFLVWLLNYMYHEFSSVPKDFLTEINLRFLKHNKNPDKKILGYWNFNQRLSQLGDFITFLETLSLLIFECNLDKNKRNIDICFIDDNHYNAKQFRFSKTYQFKKTIMSAVVCNPYVDSVFRFKSNKEFERFYQKNRKKYIRWLPTVSGTNQIDHRMIEKFYRKRGFIPKLSLPPEVTSEIYDFYKKNVYPSLPIILNIGNNADRSFERNSNSLELKKILRYHEKNKNYKFIIICNKEKMPDEFRDLNNVIFSKDYFDDLEYELGLINTSYCSIFQSSGMACFAWFNGVPFIQYGANGYNKYTCRKGKTYLFFSEYQKYFHRLEDKNGLILIFNNLIKSLEENKINNNLINKVKDNQRYEAQF